MEWLRLPSYTQDCDAIDAGVIYQVARYIRAGQPQQNIRIQSKPPPQINRILDQRDTPPTQMGQADGPQPKILRHSSLPGSMPRTSLFPSPTTCPVSTISASSDAGPRSIGWADMRVSYVDRRTVETWVREIIGELGREVTSEIRWVKARAKRGR